jgi:DNA invertase Pin-like site-specific DNA recombinase
VSTGRVRLRAAAIYVRTATAARGYMAGLDAQETRCQREAAKRALLVTRVYRDSGTGQGLSRPGLNELRAAVRAGEVAVVIVDSPGRLARDSDDYTMLLTEWQDAGATVVSAGA